MRKNEEVLAAHEFLCPGVRDHAGKTGAERIEAFSDQVGNPEFGHRVCLPVLTPEKAVHAIVTVFRNGTQRVSCPHFQETDDGGQCFALNQAVAEGQLEFNDAPVRDHPQCPYMKEY